MKRHIVLGFVLFLVALSLVGCDRPTPARPTAEPGVPLLVFERLGGIAGFQDKLVIGSNGEYYLSRQGQEERIGSLSSERRTQLQSWLERLAPFTLRLEDNPAKPDNLVRQLVWIGLGRVTANQTQQQEMLKWASDVLAELSASGE